MKFLDSILMNIARFCERIHNRRCFEAEVAFQPLTDDRSALAIQVDIHNTSDTWQPIMALMFYRNDHVAYYPPWHRFYPTVIGPHRSERWDTAHSTIPIEVLRKLTHVGVLRTDGSEQRIRISQSALKQLT